MIADGRPIATRLFLPLGGSAWFTAILRLVALVSSFDGDVSPEELDLLKIASG